MDTKAVRYFPPIHHACTKKMKRDVDSKIDLISEMPQGVIEVILKKLPIRDAVKTSLLSTKWRYRWVFMPHLVFDDEIASQYNDITDAQKGVVNFINRVLLLHDGPIHKFSLCSAFVRSSPNIDLWLRLPSLKDVKVLTIILAENEWFKAPSSVFQFKKLTYLELVQCHLELPSNFEGFSCLKYLSFQYVSIKQDNLERLISSCPLLQCLNLLFIGSFKLTIYAPQLEYLLVGGDLLDLYLENTPRLLYIDVTVSKITECLEEQSSNNYFDRLLRGVPKLEKLMGHIYFTKYLSVGYGPGCSLITWPHLKSINLSKVNFDDAKQVLVVLQLIGNSPNLEKLSISVSSNAKASRDASDLKIRDDVISSDDVLQRLKKVSLVDISGRPNEMKFIKYLLEHAVIIEQMVIYIPSLHLMNGTSKMLLELMGFRRASPRASITLLDDDLV